MDAFERKVSRQLLGNYKVFQLSFILHNEYGVQLKTELFI